MKCDLFGHFVLVVKSGTIVTRLACDLGQDGAFDIKL